MFNSTSAPKDSPIPPQERRVKCRCGRASLVVPWNLTVLGLLCRQCDMQMASGSTPYVNDALPPRTTPSVPHGRVGRRLRAGR